jgi:hypothetical protein
MCGAGQTSVAGTGESTWRLGAKSVGKTWHERWTSWLGMDSSRPLCPNCGKLTRPAIQTPTIIQYFCERCGHAWSTVAPAYRADDHPAPRPARRTNRARRH